MSSIPPNIPPIPPYDPRGQWRNYREQQKAQWRAQRDTWKAQRQAWKANYLRTYGPRVPSVVGPVLLIGIGVVALLVYAGRIASSDLWAWYGRWWPLVLIGAGLALLAEWAIDLRRTTPVRRGSGFIWILILLAFVGLSAAGWNRWKQWGVQFGDGDDSFNLFHQPEHDFDHPVQSAQLPVHASIEIDNPRGDVNITSSDASIIEVQAHEVAYAGSDDSAKHIFDAEVPTLTVTGSAVLVKSGSNSNGRVNLTVTVPKSAFVSINAGKGDVSASALGAGVRVSASHGDVQLNSIAGPVEAHFPNHRHDFSAHQIDGNLTIDGNLNDLTLSEITGNVAQNGDILGDVHIENVTGSIHLHTSVTELDVAALPGDLTLDSDDLHITEAKGQVRVITHSKDIDLSQIYGDSYVEDHDGSISVEPAGNYAIEAKNRKGDVEITLPPNASATVDGRTRNGDIVTDFGLTVSGDENKTLSGRIGSGAARIVLITENGDLRIKKGAEFPPLPVSPPAPAQPKLNVPPYHHVPSLTGTPHLKPSTAQAPKPVTQ